MSEVELDLKEFQKLLALAQRENVKKHLLEHCKKLEKKSKDVKVEEKLKIPAPMKVTKRKKTMHFRSVDSYYWIENDAKMKYVNLDYVFTDLYRIYLEIDAISDPQKVETKLNVPGSNCFDVEVYLGKKQRWKLALTKLAGGVVADKSRVKVKKGKVIVFLHKEESGSWYDLIEKEEEKEEKKPDFKDDPNAGIQDLMKKMYDTGDDKMKNMIRQTMFDAEIKRKEEAKQKEREAYERELISRGVKKQRRPVKKTDSKRKKKAAKPSEEEKKEEEEENEEDMDDLEDLPGLEAFEKASKTE